MGGILRCLMLIFMIRSNGNGYTNKIMSIKTLIDACTMLNRDLRKQWACICSTSHALEIGVHPKSSTCNVLVKASWPGVSAYSPGKRRW